MKQVQTHMGTRRASTASKPEVDLSDAGSIPAVSTSDGSSVAPQGADAYMKPSRLTMHPAVSGGHRVRVPLYRLGRFTGTDQRNPTAWATRGRIARLWHVAQMVERPTVNRVVTGSSPVVPALVEQLFNQFVQSPKFRAAD